MSCSQKNHNLVLTTFNSKKKIPR
jgi:hypothetical protein